MILFFSFYRSAILTSVPGISTELRDQVLSSVADHFDVNRISLDVSWFKLFQLNNLNYVETT